ncbi:HAD family hydrolase [Clostridium boliviensis]|uniref:HAD family hydrolase n=1 Tax=Clostridium boliviensis TaxID=318465 RepID=A0ABU4GQE3_9CLOT|nr:HAD family hydrolase [Clostridium boliviensis]MDW2799840.1 HAD family hydrolase [Clostridium boliviensis]
MQKKLIIFTDSGDTIIDEGTEIRNDDGIVVHAELIPGAGETLKALYDAGYVIAMVADGEEQSFANVYEENGLGYCFHTRTISEIVGIQKPSERMFLDAMEKNHLTEEDKKRVVMIGNNVRKDVAGANRFGITSILIDWSPRYDMNPSDEWETPDYVVHEPKELLTLIESLEAELHKDGNE